MISFVSLRLHPALFREVWTCLSSFPSGYFFRFRQVNNFTVSLNLSHFHWRLISWFRTMFVSCVSLWYIIYIRLFRVSISGDPLGQILCQVLQETLENPTEHRTAFWISNQLLQHTGIRDVSSFLRVLSTENRGHVKPPLLFKRSRYSREGGTLELALRE